jgi:hypothetical protein
MLINEIHWGVLVYSMQLVIDCFLFYFVCFRVGVFILAQVTLMPLCLYCYCNQVPMLVLRIHLAAHHSCMLVVQIVYYVCACLLHMEQMYVRIV